MQNKLKVLVVDDSVLCRKVLAQAVNNTSLGEVKYTASSGQIALARLSHSKIDIVLLDIFMPDMDGFQALKLIREGYPDVDVIMVSDDGYDNAALNVKALEMGAVDLLIKPSGDNEQENIRKIQKYLYTIFAQTITKKYSTLSLESYASIIKNSTDQDIENRKAIGSRSAQKSDLNIYINAFDKVDVIVIASSTGGPVALDTILSTLPSELNVPILVVQHMPPSFTQMLAKSLSKKCKLPVVEAADGDILEDGKVYIAPGGIHMTVEQTSGLKTMVKLVNGPHVNGVKPAADVLFRSVAQAYFKKNVLTVILTGMGNDGLMGVKSIKKSCNCYCITQSEDSCVVYGMPKSVYNAGLSDEVVHIDDISQKIQHIVLEKG